MACEKVLKYELALYHTSNIGSRNYQYLLDLLNNEQIILQDIFEKPALFDEILQLTNNSLLKKKQIDSLKETLKFPPWDLVEKDLKWAQQAKNHLLISGDTDYPQLLKQQTGYPMMLYVMGDASLLKDIQIAIVGSRNPTPSAAETAYQFAHYLATNGMVITSGMALGIDASSHQGALQARGKTIAVAGTGIDRVYPAKHRDLAHEIVEKGAVISEFPLGTAPLKQNFPKRNYTISALSVGTLVIEAALKSGSLITARLAMEQGREVFAIPGSIHNPLAKGCHYLIKQGAKLVESAEDIIEEIKPLSFASSILQQKQPPQTPQRKEDFKIVNLSLLPKDQQLMLSFIDDKPITIDQLQKRCNIAIDDVNSLVVLLELGGYILNHAGGKISLKQD